ncbi:uncharacterized protein E5676_scaffold83G00030 [Cucumis melo var. makuwa]|uniref:Reverse transcriptase domain-containing protein n=1 Tax=Cucumis melo var. makuwa TaxID=1194695 RepID=A0A5D3C2B9_CUCMM|nr:uncharacterized protein E5676_scaffold83G00030 [Cucumis melo var. makuwa]
MEVTMLNSFGSPLELGEDDNLALSLVDGSPPLLQVDDSAIVLRDMICVYASKNNVERGYFGVAWLHSEAFSGSPLSSDMEDFDIAIREACLVEPLVQALRLEEASLRQNSKIRWLELDDQNTAFLHHIVRSRMSHNSFLSLVDSDGSRLTSHDGVVQLAAPSSSEEVRRVLFSMDSGKAPSPNGFSVGFFKGVNATAITIISKHCKVERMEDFRPISCSNPLCTMNVDLQKAYDSINSDFLFGLLMAIGTPLRKGIPIVSNFISVVIRKSSIFVTGVSNEAASSLAASLDFVLGNPHIRYLGLPLLSGRLRLNDCVPLIQHIISRRGVKVAWVEVCLSFKEGGLAIRDEPSWNIASSMKIPWLLLTSSASLWDSLKENVWVEVGDGRRCRVWLDLWLQGSPILEQIEERVLYDAASQMEARLFEFIVSDRWV